MSKQIMGAGGSLAGLAVVICIAVAANVIVGNLRVRKDLTDEKLYTLSNGTRDVLQKLEEPVTLKLFFNESNPQVPMHLKSFAQRVQDLLTEYEVAARGKLTVVKFDPKQDSDAEEWAQRYGVVGQPAGFMGPTLYLGLVAVMGDAEAVLPVLDPQTENLLEYNITRLVTRVAHPRKPVVGVLSSLPVAGSPRQPFPMPGRPPSEQPAWFAFRDLREDYQVRNLQPPLQEIEPDVDALVLVHPKDLNDQTLFAIDQFVLRGGRLFVFVDPLCVTEAETQPAPQMGGFGGKSSNLEKLFGAWGVTFDPTKVVADLEAVSRLRIGQGNRVEESPVWLSLQRRHFSAEDILTAQLESIMMPYAGAFTVNAADGVKVTRLMASSETSGLVDAMTAQFSMDGIRRDFRSGLARLDLAVRLTGKLKTAFPDGKPKAEDKPDAEGKEAKDEKTEEPAGDFLKESKDTSSVVLVGDADMIYDRFCVQELNFLGYRGAQPINDNLVFFMNTLEQLAGSSALIGIRARGRTQRPFKVVMELQGKAQQRFMDEEARLQRELETAQQQLSELQTKKDASQRVFLSPEQKQAIDRFQAQVADAKKKLKDVRRKLREDIERLGVKVKVINILLMPVLVALAGIGFSTYRRNRKQS